MLYVILDPCHDYAANMVKFLKEYDRKGIAVFTDPEQLEAFHHMNREELGECLVDEYLVTEYPNLQALAEQIGQDWRDQDEIEGIIPWAEFTIELGAELGEHLGLDWNSREVIHRFRNKYALKEHLRTHSNVKINASRIVTNEDEAREFQESLDKWPIVVKPTEGAGSRKVFFADNMDDLIAHCGEVFSGGLGDVLLEEYIGGREYVVNGVTNAAHDVLITDVWLYDKRDSHGFKNLYYETIKIDSTDPVFEPLGSYAGSVIEALGLKKAPFHMELKLEDDGPCLVEVGARFAGGNQPLLASQLHERSLFELAACHYMADLPLSLGDVHYDKYDSYHARLVNGIQSVEIPSVSAIHGLEEVQALPSFFMVGFVKPIGSWLPVSQDHSGKSYEIYLLHEDEEQVFEDAQRVRELLWYE